VERVPDKTGRSTQADTLASRRDPHPELAHVVAAVEVDGQSRPSGFWDAVELLRQRLRACTVKLAERVEWHRTTSDRILDASGMGSVHGGTCGLTTSKVPKSWLTKC
jgi:hypothetical protein